ncbi:variable surface protein [Plasmodium gonderi]|uniref:Variable surface protein n=1 Tax=Plasmodium gonderi TaxID=77519 RepID=A0A1Y1JNP8_PLAGO|nr:variable surface protein [Plasmodium gonderi]GAW84089.1 variable surface protein [Plasmodium gonderi]
MRESISVKDVIVNENTVRILNVVMKEKPTAVIEFKSEKENPDKEQEETNTDNFDKNQELSSPMDDDNSTRSVKLQTTPESLSVTINSLDNALVTSENNESSENISAHVSNTGVTYLEGDSNKDIARSIIKVPERNDQITSLKKCNNAVIEISNIITFAYKTYFSTVFSNIPCIKNIADHIDDQSPDKRVPKDKKSNGFHTSLGNTGVEHDITVINIRMSTAEEGTPDQRIYDNGTNEGIIRNRILFDEMYNCED